MRHLRPGRLIPAALVLLLAGCGSAVDFVRMDPTVYPPKPSDAAIEVHQGSVLTPHVVIGLVTATRAMEATTGSTSTYDEVLRMLKQKARQVGGDALLDVKPVYSEEGRLDTNVQLQAKVVRYLEKQASVSAQ